MRYWLAQLTDAEADHLPLQTCRRTFFGRIAAPEAFLKLYPVVRNLANNPRCPLDISLTLVKTLPCL